ncbi:MULTISPECIES: nucleotidyltransferase [unclassified Variovorax]|uniref:nucleotidyltransferase n=1 Tax=unclassified Variovorax TaxID=663243 RepID=UPI001BD382E6|nr:MULTISPECIES: nucleotidyltransferase [unclassified Variovorax]
MHRDLPINPVRRRFSAGASAKFVFLAEAIGRVYEPTQTQLSDLDRAYQSTGEYLAACAEFEGLLYRVHAYGSRQLGTMVRPMDPLREGYDVDLAACLAREGLLRYGGPGGPARLIEHMYVALKRYADRHDLKLARNDRCVTMTYAGGMKADFSSIIDDPSQVVLYGDTHGRIPDRDLQRYLSTNPRGYCQAFDKAALIAPTFEGRAALNATFDSMRKSELIPLPDADEVFARLLSRLVQLTKINRNIAFGAPRDGANLAPSSSILTTLVANAYAIEAPKPHDGPMDLLLDIVQLMPTLIKRFPMPDGSEFWYLDNPTAQNDNLAACMDTQAKQKAFDAWHERLVMDLNALVDAIDQGAGMDVVARAVERVFGPRAQAAVLENNAQRREANRSAGRGILVLGSGAGVTMAARAHTNYGD